MATVFLGLGSNIDTRVNLSLGIRELRNTYGAVTLSAVYQSPPLGFAGDDFLNLVARIDTEETPAAIHAELERIHTLAGRARGCSRYLARTLDIDLLLYEQLMIHEPPIRLPRSDVLEYSFVLRPLAEIAPDFVHPVTGRTLATEWAEFDASSQPLLQVDDIL